MKRGRTVASGRKTRIALLGILGLGAVAAPAAAVQLIWNNPSGGNAATASNWTPSQVPTLSDYVVFNLDNTYTVNFGSSLDETWNQRYRGGNVSVNFTSPHTMTGPLEIAACCGDSAKMRILSGDLTCLSSIEIADASSPIGTLELSGSDVSLTKDGNAGNLTVSENGTGKLIILGGADCDLADGGAVIGVNNGSNGTLYVSGFDISPIRRSSFEVSSGFGANLTVGLRGTGRLDIVSGGAVSCQYDVYLADENSAHGTVDLSSSLINSTLFVANDLKLANDGIGVLNVRDGSSVTVGNRLWLTDASGTGTGTLHVETGGTVTTHGLELEDNGVLDFDGGLIRVDGGELDPDGEPVIISSTVGTPVLELTNGATGAFIATVSPMRALQIGTNGTGTVSLLGGSDVSITQGNLVMAANTGGNGTLNIRDGSSLTAPSYIYAGSNGVASIIVSLGGQIDVPKFELGVTANGDGTLQVLNSGSDVTASQFLTVGGEHTVSGGDGRLVVSDNATVQCPGSGNGMVVWPDGSIDVNHGAVLSVTNTMEFRGTGSLNLATINAGLLNMKTGADLTANGAINGKVAMETSSAIHASAPLSLGLATDPLAISFAGLLDIGGQSVTLLDSNGPLLGDVDLAGGSLTYAAEGTFTSGKSLTGNGLINGRLRSTGASIIASGAGLRFNDVLVAAGGTLGGTLMRFLGDGALEGAGTLNCAVDFDPGSIVTATGDLTMGNSGSASGVLMDGDMYVGSHTVVLKDANTINLGPLTSLGGGTLIHTNVLSVDPAHVLLGTGAVTATTLDNLGRVSPGNSIGQLTVNAAYRNQTGVLEIELGDHATGECDRLTINGAATWSGTLFLKPAPSFSAHAGDIYTVATHTSRTGTFSNVVLQGFASGTTFDVNYSNTRVQIIMTFNPAAVGDEVAVAAELPTSLELRSVGTFADAPSLELGLPRAGQVALGLYDITGRSVLSLENGPAAAGWHRYDLAREAKLSGGIYFGRVTWREASGRPQERTTRVCIVR